MEFKMRLGSKLLQFLSWVILFLLIMSPIILSAGRIRGSGNLVTIEKDIKDFDQIEISHSFQVTIKYAKDYSVSVQVDDNLKDYVIIEKHGRRLKISLERGFCCSNPHLEAAITLPDIRQLSLSGASSAEISGFEFNHRLDLDLSGASRVDGVLKTGDMDLDLSGASSIELKGKGRNLGVHASGASTLRMSEFLVGNARLSLSGASNCLVNIAGELDVHASGSSNVKYCGKGTLGSIEASGCSRIKRI
jgi:hypothetical protein